MIARKVKAIVTLNNVTIWGVTQSIKAGEDKTKKKHDQRVKTLNKYTDESDKKTWLLSEFSWYIKDVDGKPEVVVGLVSKYPK